MYLIISLFATVLFATLFKLSCTSETIFIKTNSSDYQCPAEPCLTLQEFISHHHHVESNTVVRFLPGKHMLLFTTSTNISIINVFNVTLTGASDHQNSVIHCVSEFGIIAANVQNFRISKLSFSGCGTPVPEGIIVGHRSRVPRPTTLFLVHASNVSIVHTKVYNSRGTGMLAINAFDLALNQASFIGNKPNCIVRFDDKSNTQNKLHVITYIADSQFAYGRSDNWYYGGGLSFTFFQTLYTVQVNIINVALYNNIGTYGNFFMIIKGSCSHTMVRVEKVRSSNELQRSEAGFSFIDLSNNSLSIHQRNYSLQSGHTVHVLNSYFYASVDTIAIDISSAYRNLKVKFTDIILYNKRNTGYGMYISNVVSMVLERMNVNNVTSPIVVVDTEITIHNAFILENEGILGVATLWKSKVKFLGDISFIRNYPHEENEPGAVYAYSSTLIFLGNVDFVDNKGYNGGAMALYAGSEMVLGKYAHLKFCRNHAKHLGGAVYVDNHMLFNFVAISCFYKLADPFSSRMKWHVVFENNTADYAGSALFGGWVDFCEIDDPQRPVKPNFNSTFHVNGGESDLSVIASNPLRVCLCIDSKPECSITQYNISAYPGTTIQIPAVAVGQRFGTVTSTVHSDILYQQMNGIHPNIKDWQHTQRVEKYCTNLTYTIMSLPHIELTITVKAEKLGTPDRGILRAAAERNFEDNLSVIDPDFYFNNLLINSEMLQCPVGFEYQNTSMICTCDSKLVEYGIKNCSIDAQTIWRKNSFWIAIAEGRDGVIVHEHCPFDYCKATSFDLDLEDPDEQCAFHRSGILCGACQNNLSHVFGTSMCRDCSSLRALLWFPVIALAGIALVVLLIVLNLTVSMGTINGLIFYANIVRANHTSFFPPNTSNSFFSWLIAWINLDLGIETCFYNGLDAYVKTWLQFVFPLYIWFLVIAIIVLSHYFTFATRLSGRNAVPVLATLFLLSYAKLLRIVITVLQYTELHFPYNSVRKVWLYDGNVDYLKGKHIPLFIAALLLLLISVPYTVVLIFTQQLQYWSSYRSRVLFWVQKLKPLFDAYTGPYKNKHRYWTGLLLLVRILLILLFALNTHGSPNSNLLAITLTVLSLFMHAILVGSVYKTWHLNVIEYSFFLNLGVLASATLYTTVTEQDQLAVTYTSVGIAFALFIIIVVLHTITKLSSCNSIFVNFLKKVNVKLSKIFSAIRKIFCKQRGLHHNTQPRVTHATVELRESLLEYCSQ